MVAETSKGPHAQKMAGLFESYSLNSLEQGPKSGYDIIKEIEEKSHGKITASKGTIYPLLDSLEKAGRIRICGTGTRSKKIYALTKKGEIYLDTLDKMERSFRQKMNYMPLLFQDFRRTKSERCELLFKIRCASQETEDEKQVLKVLKKCLGELEAIKSERKEKHEN